MRLGSLNYNPRSEEGEVKWEPTMDFSRPDVGMLDTLGDWIAILTDTYNDLHAVTFKDTDHDTSL
jgi:hypothetical protein